MVRTVFTVFCLLTCLAASAESSILIVPDDFTSIQEAINAAGSGDTVEIRAGEYEGPIALKQGITLKGAGREKVILRSPAEAGPVLSVSDCQDGNVTGITFEHIGRQETPAEGDVSSPVCHLVRSSIEMTDCEVRNGRGDGIEIEGEGKCAVRNSRIHGNARRGILIRGVGSAPTLENNEVSRNGGSGIFFASEAGGIALQNDCIKNKGSGIIVADQGTEPDIAENTSADNGINGIYYLRQAGGKATRNSCFRNGWNGISVAGNGTAPTLDQNNLYDNRLHGIFFGQGIRAEVGSNTFTKNEQISSGEIVHLFQTDKFEDLEEIVNRLRKEKKRFPSGEWQLRFFYNYLVEGTRRMSSQEQDSYTEKINRWKEQYPDSITWRIALARAEIDWAWRDRGGGYADTITSQGWRGFEKHLNKAWDILLEAEDLETKDPELYAALLKVGYGLGKDQSSMTLVRALWNLAAGGSRMPMKPSGALHDILTRGTQVEELYYPIYYARTTSLLPRWGGEPGELERFAEWAASRTNELEGEAMYARIATSALRYVGVDTYLERFNFSWPRIEFGHLDILRKYPDSSYRRNYYCRFACMYRDRQAAAHVFKEIAENWDSSVWKSKYQFNRWKDWAEGVGPDPSGGELVAAVKGSDLRNVRELVSGGANVETANDEGKTLLYLAIDREDLDLAAYLIEADADVNYVAPNGRNILQTTLGDSTDEALRLLLENGADPNKPNGEGWPPLVLALAWDYTDKISVLLEYKADPNADYQGWSSLYYALKKGHVSAATALLEHGADPNKRTGGGWPPLMLAALWDRPEMVSFLLEHGADPDVAHQKGWTALHWAARAGSTETVVMLLDHGVDVDQRTENESTALYQAAYFDQLEIVKILLDRGADVHATVHDEENETALAIAEEKGHTEVIKFLREKMGIR